MAKIGINLATGSLQKKEIVIGIDLGATWGKIAVIHPGSHEPVVLREFDGRFKFSAPDEQASDGLVLSFEGLVKLFSELKDRARHILKTTAGKALIAIPTSFSLSRRIAIKQAARLSGLEVLGIVNKHTAAAAAYAMKLDAGQQQFIGVAEWGVGQVMVSVVSVSNNSVAVIRTGIGATIGEAGAMALTATETSWESISGWLEIGEAPGVGETGNDMTDVFGNSSAALSLEEPVALGAAILADRKLPGFVVREKTVRELLVESSKGVEILFTANEPLPVAATKAFQTSGSTSSWQCLVHEHGEEPVRILVEDIPSLSDGQATINIEFLLNEEGILSATAFEEKTNLELSVDSQPAIGLTGAQFDNRLLEINESANLPLAMAEREAEQLVDKSRRFLVRHQGRLTDKDKQDVQKGIDELMAIIVFSNKDIVNKNISVLQAALQSASARIVDQAAGTGSQPS